ncbi:MAG: tryptophan-rich sensory protein [Anaerolineae bacterium]|nr:tryptophan-rich sensory protein [Anaerolineae bacterium]
MMKNTNVLKWVNVGATVAMIVVNALANALPLNGLNTGEISDRFEVYFVPAGYVFSIWGLIYLALLAFTIYQLTPHSAGTRDRIGYLYALSAVANIAWIFLWHYEVFPLTLIAMLVLLGSLIAIYLLLGIGVRRPAASERWTVNFPFSLYLGWITVATVANVTSLLDYLNWGGWGIAPEAWAVIMLIVAAGVALAVSFTRGDITYITVIVWAYIGIAVKHGSTPVVAIPATVLATLVGLSLVVTVPRVRRRLASAL